MPCASFSMLDGLGGTPVSSSDENYAHGIANLLLIAQVSETFLHSEVNLIIQYKNKIRAVNDFTYSVRD